VLSSGIAACARLPAGTGLAKLTGVRLPLAADAGGAEVRVVVLGHVAVPPIDGEPKDRDVPFGPFHGSEPGTPVKGGQSAPVTVAEAATSQVAPWQTFLFDQPIEIEEGQRPWIAIQVSRGRVRWALGEYGAAIPVPVRRGAPEGPWVRLPSVFRTMPNLQTLGGRIRAIGLAPADHPIPPFRLSIKNFGGGATAQIPVVPTAKGFGVTWRQATPLPITTRGSLVLEVVSHVAGSLTLRDLDLTLTTT
jgi:hypothetical protein